MRHLVLSDPVQRKSDAVFADRPAATYNDPPDAGLVLVLTNARSARLGSGYMGVCLRITPALEETYQNIADDVPEFHFGRFDLRIRSMCREENLREQAKAITGGLDTPRTARAETIRKSLSVDTAGQMLSYLIAGPDASTAVPGHRCATGSVPCRSGSRRLRPKPDGHANTIQLQPGPRDHAAADGGECHHPPLLRGTLGAAICA